MFDDIVPGTQKRILWAGEPGAVTPVSLVYLHGFATSSEEIRPVPDQLAAALGANLFYARLAGHGRGGAALAGPVVNDWIVDLAEAMEIGRAIGDKVVVIASGASGALAALGARDHEIAARLKGIAFLSPVFRLADPHARYWTESYPTVALLPMAALVEAARGAAYDTVTTPALFVYAPGDRVADGEETARIAARWGGPVTVESVTPQEGTDPDHHVLAGAILSPAGSAPMVARLRKWIDEL